MTVFIFQHLINFCFSRIPDLIELTQKVIRRSAQFRLNYYRVGRTFTMILKKMESFSINVAWIVLGNATSRWARERIIKFAIGETDNVILNMFPTVSKIANNSKPINYKMIIFWIFMKPQSAKRTVLAVFFGRISEIYRTHTRMPSGPVEVLTGWHLQL